MGLSYSPILTIPLAGGGLKWTLGSFGCFATKCSAHFRHSLAGGGLKWTRTIDLTLIRRVL